MVLSRGSNGSDGSGSVRLWSLSLTDVLLCSSLLTALWSRSYEGMLPNVSPPPLSFLCRASCPQGSSLWNFIVLMKKKIKTKRLLIWQSSQNCSKPLKEELVELCFLAQSGCDQMEKSSSYYGMFVFLSVRKLRTWGHTFMLSFIKRTFLSYKAGK